MTLYYLLILFVTAFLSILAYIGVLGFTKANNRSVAVVNVTGRQRMLLQRIARLALQMSTSKKAEERGDLRKNLIDSISMMRKAHEGLLNGNPEMNLPGKPSPTLKAIYFELPTLLENRLLRYLYEAEAVANAPKGEGGIEDPHLQYISLEASGGLAEAIDLAVSQAQREGESFIWKLEFFGVVILGSTLALLAGTGLLIFRPMVRRLEEEAAMARESRKNIQSIVNTVGDGIITIDAESRIIFANRELCNIFGYTETELVGQSLLKLIPEKYRESHLRGIKNYLNLLPSRVLERYQEFEGMRKNGSLFPLELRVGKTVVEDEGGGKIIFTGSIRDISQRRQMHNALRESEEKFRGAFENSPFGMTVTSLDGKWLRVNRALCEMVGYSEEEMMARFFRDITHPDDIEKDLVNLERLMRREIPFYHTEKRYIHRMGHTIWVQLSVSLVSDQQGAPLYYVSQIANITERKEADARLTESEKRYRSLTESANDAIVSADGTGNIISWNGGAEKIFGHTEKEVLGKPLTILMPERYRELHTRGLGRASSTGRFQVVGRRLELYGLGKDGKEFPIEISVATWNSEKGIFYSGIIRDISDRRQTEFTLRTLSNAIEQTNEMVMVTDAEGTIEYVNPSFERITGYGRHEVIGKNPRLLKSGRQPQEFYEGLWSKIKAGKMWGGEIINKRKSGEYYEEEMTISPVRDGEGKITHFVAIKRDISERKILRDQLVQAEKLSSIGTFVSGVAHELNNPLTAVLGFSERLISKSGELPPGAARELGIIAEQTRRTIKIVQNLLRFTRKTSSAKTTLNISDALDGILSLQDYILRSDNIEIIKCYAAEPLWVKGDVSQLQQVFLNIIMNGAYEMKKANGRGVFTVRTESRDGEVLVSIENDGPPLTPEGMTRLFDPFYTTKEVGDGTGLGLYIAYGIVKEHKGRMRAENVGNAGVRFVIVLPHEEPKKGSDLPVSTESPRPRFNGHRMLIAEDDDNIREWLSDSLRKNGAVVDICRNGRQAVDFLRKTRYDLVISDIKMPGLDGYSLGSWINENLPEGLDRFMVITGVIDREVDEFRDRFGCRVLQKPFDESDFNTAICAELQRQRRA